MSRSPRQVRSWVAVMLAVAALWQTFHTDISQARRTHARSPKVESSAIQTGVPPVETIVEGRVVKVSDGDTVVVLEESSDPGQSQGAASIRQVKVRLDGIDAPEKSQPYGEYCRKKLADKVAGKRVRVHVRKLDRYGRSLGKIEVPGIASVNLEQVKEGCGWFYRQYAREHSASERREYEDSEARARSRRLGLWQDKDPAPPWDFRRVNKRGGRESEVHF